MAIDEASKAFHSFLSSSLSQQIYEEACEEEHLAVIAEMVHLANVLHNVCGASKVPLTVPTPERPVKCSRFLPDKDREAIENLAPAIQAYLETNSTEHLPAAALNYLGIFTDSVLQGQTTTPVEHEAIHASCRAGKCKKRDFQSATTVAKQFHAFMRGFHQRRVSSSAGSWNQTLGVESATMDSDDCSNAELICETAMAACAESMDELLNFASGTDLQFQNDVVHAPAGSFGEGATDTAETTSNPLVSWLSDPYA